MKREGRQHGMVDAYRFTHARQRSKTQLEPPSLTAAPFVRVSQKPTNHSKFTGKCNRPRCGGCHTHPVEKSRYKAKGTQRIKYSDVVTNHRLVTWRVVDARLAPGLKLTGFSATDILDHLANDNYYLDEIEGDDIDIISSYDDYGDGDGVYDYGLQAEFEGTSAEGNQGEGAINDDDDDDRMSFCDVGFIWEEVEGDGGGWCLVEEM